MITEATKSGIIARYKRNVPIEEIAEHYELPIVVVKEITGCIAGHDLVQLEANVHAVANFANQELMNNPKNIQILQDKLEEAALDIANEVYTSTGLPDPMHAKALNLHADTITKLYSTFVTKRPAESGGSDLPDGSTLAMFSTILKA